MSRDYLSIEPFLKHALEGRALQQAFESGLIDRLLNEPAPRAELARIGGWDIAGTEFLLGLLAQSDVIETQLDDVRLTASFQSACRYRDLILTKIQFAEKISGDVMSRFPELLTSENAFMQTSKLFEFFDYSRCFEINPANCLHASQWMRLTTMLSRYEGPVCCEIYDFSAHRRMLDMGGNSGEFALQVCRRNRDIEAMVADLPVVCHVGKRHLEGHPEAERISFAAGNMTTDEIPGGCDLISWKSVLHDWPDEDVRRFLRRSFAALPPGGRILIFERRNWDLPAHQITYGSLPTALFFRSYRNPNRYEEWLRQIGFCDIKRQEIMLDLPFVLISACRMSDS